MGLLFEERGRSPSGTFLGFGEGSRVQAEVPVGGRAVTVSPCHVCQVRPQECGSGESDRALGAAPRGGEEGSQVGREGSRRQGQAWSHPVLWGSLVTLRSGLGGVGGHDGM